MIQTDFGDYLFSKAYDLLATVLHSPNESDTALDLYEDDYKSPFYEHYGYFGRPDFETAKEKYIHCYKDKVNRFLPSKRIQ